MSVGGRGYERLSGLDHAFLHFETPESYMHVALTGVFSPGSLARPDGGIDIVRIRAHLESRLHLIPRYRQRLHYVPLTSDPVWVDDEEFDLAYHVRHSNLPRPGGEDQLKTLVARILERPLDRRRPLWEIWFIEGLDGGRFAMLSKVHHCMVDGIAGIDLLAALLGMQPETRVEPPRPWHPAPPPSTDRLLRDEIGRRVRGSLDLVRQLPAIAAGPSRADLGTRLGSLWRFLSAGVREAAASPLNGTIGPHRRVEWVGIDLASVRELKHELGGTVNDVALTVVCGVMRRFLLERDGRTGRDFRAFVPVSTRARSERGETGNRVSAWIVPLPVDEPRPLERHRRISRATASCRDNGEKSGAEVLTGTADWATWHGLALAMRLVRQTRAFNVIVTNVPGPPMPLFLLDAPMVTAYPHVPLFATQGLGIALLSYAGRLFVGFVGDWDLLADIDRLPGWTEASVAELRSAARLLPTRTSDLTLAVAVGRPVATSRVAPLVPRTSPGVATVPALGAMRGRAS